MPFGVEMLHLLGMEVTGDWWQGGLVGQLLVATFAPMAGLAIGLTARRWGSPRAGWVAAAVYLTTPWVYRLAAIPYAEGPLCYYHAALAWAAGVAWGSPAAWRGRAWLVVGLLAGGAMAILYTGPDLGGRAVRGRGSGRDVARSGGGTGGRRRPDPALSCPPPSSSAWAWRS